jgi:hypothetical protein
MSSSRTALSPKVERGLIMLSHSNPEDNEPAIWLATQLASMGYQVWCDKAQFLVGEHFWSTIDPIIRDHAIKFIYLLSRTSNELGSRRGFIDELELAFKIEKQLVPHCKHWKHPFVLPIAIDDLPISDYMIHFAAKNVLPFRDWAAGFTKLLEALTEDQVPKFESLNQSTVRTWWEGFRDVRSGECKEEHELLTNQFRILRVPQDFFVHTIQYFGPSTHLVPSPECPPIFQVGFEVYTFAKSEELLGKLGDNVVLERRNKSISLNDVLADGAPAYLQMHRPHLKALFRVVWEKYAEGNAGIGSFQMANGKRCFFFKKPINAPAVSVKVKFGEEVDSRRFLVRSFGRKRNPLPDSPAPKLRYYHFGVDGHVHFNPLSIEFGGHVLFSDDGLQPWASSRRMHRARRSFCAGWYNDRWRDCLLAYVTALSAGNKEIEIPVAFGKSVIIACEPMTLTSDTYFRTKQEAERSRTEGQLPDDEEVQEEILESIDQDEQIDWDADDEHEPE